MPGRQRDGFVQVHRVAAGQLGAVHRDVGGLEDLVLAVVQAVKEGHADARRAAVLDGACSAVGLQGQQVGASQGLADFLGDGQGFEPGHLLVGIQATEGR